MAIVPTVPPDKYPLSESCNGYMPSGLLNLFPAVLLVRGFRAPSGPAVFYPGGLPETAPALDRCSDAFSEPQRRLAGALCRWA